MNKKSSLIRTILITTVFILVVAIANLKFPVIGTPMRCKMEEYQIDFITISTVFAGFSFTILGIILGLSSEELVRRINKTSIIIDQVNTIVTSIVLCMISVAISLIIVLGVDISAIKLLNKIGVCNMGKLASVDSILYIMGIGFLIGGIIFFIKSVKNFYNLIAHIYNFNRHKNDEKIVKLKEALKSDEQEHIFDDEEELIQQ